MSPAFWCIEIGGDDDGAVRASAKPQQLLHPRIVAGAVEHHDLRGRDLAHDGGRGLEQMRVLIGIVQDADDSDAVAADLARDAAVKILRRHHGDLVAGGLGRKGRGKGQIRAVASPISGFMTKP